MSITYVMETGSLVIRATAAETGGAYSIVEYTAQPGHSRTRHIHRNMIEAFLVLEGEGTFEVGQLETPRYTRGNRSDYHQIYDMGF